MELRESIESINEKLKSEFGTFSDGRSNFKVVFSEDEFEKRWIQHTDEGFELLHPEVRLVPKYKQLHKQKYILERLVPVSKGSDLVEKTSYEPAWVFQTSTGEYLPPRFDMCQFVIDSIFAAMNKSGTHVKYRDENTKPEVKEQRLKEMEAELFGNETEVGDHLAYGTGVTVPENKLIQ